VLGDGAACQRCTCTRCGSGLSKGLCYICGNNQNSLNGSPSISENSSQSPPHINHHCCYECGDPLESIFCRQCTCKLCGNGAHYGCNCPPKVPIIPDPEPFHNQTIKELPPTMQSFDPKLDLIDESPNFFYPPPQPPVYSCEFYGNDAHYGHYCTPQALFIYPEPSYQCQPMNEDYYYGQNSCYDSTSIGFDQSQPQQYTVNHPLFNAHNDYLDSQITLNITLTKLMEQMTSLTSFCEMACQIVQKKQDEKQVEEEQAAKAQNWKLPICYDDDDDEEISKTLEDNIIYGLPPGSAITPNKPILSTEEPDNALNQFEDFFESNDEFSSIDDDSFSIDNIDYVEAPPPNSEFVSSEVMEIFIPETKSSSTSLNSLLEETNTFDNSLPAFETFFFDVEEIHSGVTTTHYDISLPEYEAFYNDHVKEISSGSPTTHSDSSLFALFIFDLSINPFHPADRSDFMSSPMNSFTSYLHQSMIVSSLRLNLTREISPRM
nr:hypothetical protein [Tanacetum cinerariifolium]